MSHQTAALLAKDKRPKRPSPENVFGYLMEMGTGKTKVVLDEFQELCETALWDLLVIAPAGAYRNWYRDKNETQRAEIVTHLDPVLYKRLAWAAWEGGADARRKREWLLTVTDRPRAFFVNVEAFSGPSGKAEAYCKAFLTPGRSLMVIDESTRIRGKRAERRKAIMRLRVLARARRIMTGEVAPKNPLDVFPQFEFLDWRILGYKSAVAFRARYAIVKRECYLPQPIIQAKLRDCAGIGKQVVTDYALEKKLGIVWSMDPMKSSKRVPRVGPGPDAKPRTWFTNEIDYSLQGVRRAEALELIEKLGGYIQSVPKIDGYQNVEEIHQKIAPYTYRALKRDCLDLEPKVYEPRDVELTDEQRRMYAELKEFATTQIENSDKHVTTNAVITQMIRLHQLVCGHTRDDETDELHDVSSNRIEAVQEVLQESSGKAIIWMIYDREIRKLIESIRKEYGDGSVAGYWGGNRGTRDAEERRFLSLDKCRFIVASQPTGGLGNTWNVANLTIYAANSHDLEHRIQSEDRNHRRGQTESVTYVDLIARGTVEERIVNTLRSKIDLATVVNGENYREWLI